jgi:hypothetical protein
MPQNTSAAGSFTGGPGGRLGGSSTGGSFLLGGGVDGSSGSSIGGLRGSFGGSSTGGFGDASGCATLSIYGWLFLHRLHFLATSAPF